MVDIRSYASRSILVLSRRFLPQFDENPEVPNARLIGAALTLVRTLPERVACASLGPKQRVSDRIGFQNK